MIYIMRHGQTDYNKNKKIQGQIDIPLNEEGIRQAIEARTHLKDQTIKKIYSSDLSRAYKTAQIINEVSQTDILVDIRLRENCFGKLEGTSFLEIDEYIWDTLNTQPEIYNSEGWLGMYNRLKPFYEEIKSEQDILIVAHAGTLTMLRYIALDIPFSIEEYKIHHQENIHIKNCELIKL